MLALRYVYGLFDFVRMHAGRLFGFSICVIAFRCMANLLVELSTMCCFNVQLLLYKLFEWSWHLCGNCKAYECAIQFVVSIMIIAASFRTVKCSEFVSVLCSAASDVIYLYYTFEGFRLAIYTVSSHPYTLTLSLSHSRSRHNAFLWNINGCRVLNDLSFRPSRLQSLYFCQVVFEGLVWFCKTLYVVNMCKSIWKFVCIVFHERVMKSMPCIWWDILIDKTQLW